MNPTEEDMKVLRAVVGTIPTRGVTQEDRAQAEKAIALADAQSEYWFAIMQQDASTENRIARAAKAIARIRMLGGSLK